MLQAAVLCLAAVSAPPVKCDVALDQHSILRGRTSPNTQVVLENAGQTTRVNSGVDGRFAVQIRAGIYVVRVGDSRLLCRAWAPRTAPPVAASELLLPANVVRGQDEIGCKRCILDELTWPIIIVGGIGLAGWAAIDGSGS